MSSPRTIEPGREQEAEEVNETALARPSSQTELQNVLFAALGSTILIVGFVVSVAAARRTTRRNLARFADAQRQGLDEPPGMYPRVDLSRCIGCGTCVRGCHGDGALGLIAGRAQLIAAANCVGCGTCGQNCPMQAVKLVFGTAKRPVELPRLDACGQTTVRGIYVAGELGGMGLVANAMESGIATVTHIARDLHQSVVEVPLPSLDLIIVGAGPAGLGAALKAEELGLSYLCVDQAAWGGAVNVYPRGKRVMTRPVRLPLWGPLKLHETSKEILIATWQRIVAQTQIKIRENTRVEGVCAEEHSLQVQTSQGAIVARRVLLTLGRAGTPRTLGVAGEDAPHVSYQMIDPEPWARRDLVVIGGGDVACEAAVALVEQPHTAVTLIHRGKSLSRPKPGNRQRVEQAIRERGLRLLLDADILRIEPHAVCLTIKGQQSELSVSADHVFICCGGVPPTGFLQGIGADILTVRGEVPS